MTETILTHQAITCGDPEKIIGGGVQGIILFSWEGGGGARHMHIFWKLTM